MREKGADRELEELETDLFLQAVIRRYGYDLRYFERAAVVSRIKAEMLALRAPNISRFQELTLHRPAVFRKFLQGLSARSGPMFSDPAFYWTFRTRVVPKLRTYPFVRIWYAGCATGEDVYSMAILLDEEGLYPRSRIYATDMSEQSVRTARMGRFSASAIENYSGNYLQARGKRSLADYFRIQGNRVLIMPGLKEHLFFSEHNLTTDGSFNEFQVVVCRETLTKFAAAPRVHIDKVIFHSLSRLGILAVGSEETLTSLPHGSCYSVLDAESGLYQKTGSGCGVNNCVECSSTRNALCS